MSDTPPHNPTLLGDFLIHGLLGEGGSGTVYDARWGHREVALKVLHGDLGEGERRRFLSEARLLVEMTHPGVVKVLAAGTLPDGRPYLAMEKLPGESLAHRLARGPLALAQAVPLFTQLCHAVAAMHARSLIHRDLKPENVMLVPGPAGEHAVLLDFGIAKAASDGVAAPTQSGQVRGTPAYMAPERFFGHPASIATDVYELAVTLFAMLAGRLPWDDSADPEVRLNPARLAEVADVPAALDEVVARSLSTRAPNRPASVAALCEEVVTTAGVAAPVRPRSTAPVAPHAHPPGLSEAPTERVTVAGKATTTTGGAASGERAGTTAQVRRRRWPLALGGAMVVIGAAVAGILYAGRGDASRVLSGRDDPWSSDHPRPPVVEDAGPPPPPRLEAEVRDSLRQELADAAEQLPADAHILGAVALEELRATPELARLMAGIGETPIAGMLGIRAGRCALELAPRTRWLVFSAVDSDDGFDAIARGTWTREEVERCLLGDTLTRPARRAVRGRPGKALTVITRPGADLVLAWLDEHTVATSSRTGADVAFVTAMLAPAKAKRASRARELARALDRRATLWMVADRAALAGQIERPALRDIDGAFRMAFDDDGDLGIQLAVDFADETRATAGEAALRDDLSEITDTFGFGFAIPDFAIRRDGATVRLDTVLPARLVDKLQDGTLEVLKK